MDKNSDAISGRVFITLPYLICSIHIHISSTVDMLSYQKSLHQIKNITNNNNSQSTDRNKNSQQFWLDCLAQHNHTWKT